MPYSLRRIRDGAGDSGPLSLPLRLNPETKQVEYDKENPRPRVGWAIQVGSFYTRTYQAQDYWQTTYVTEILKDTPDEIHFKTGNSEYVWKRI